MKNWGARVCGTDRDPQSPHRIGHGWKRHLYVQIYTVEKNGPQTENVAMLLSCGVGVGAFSPRILFKVHSIGKYESTTKEKVNTMKTQDNQR